MNKILLTLLCSFLFAVMSCVQKPHYLYDTKEFCFQSDSFQIIDGKNIDLSVLGMNELFIIDTLLIITTNDPSGLMKVFSINTLKPIANIAIKGRAKNEFINIQNPSRMYYYKDGNLIMPVIDNSFFFKEINISKSIKNSSTIINNTSDCIHPASGSFVLLNNDYLNRFEYQYVKWDEIVKNKAKHGKYLIHNYSNETNQEMKIFNKMIVCEKEYDINTYYHNRIFKHPTKNIIIQPFILLDYILFFDLDNKKYFASHRLGSSTFSDIAPALTIDTPSHFSSFVSSFEDFFMILYYADSYTIERDNAIPELLIFDWDGNFLSGAKLNTSITTMSYDSIHRILYGARYYDEQIFSFDLNELMKSIGK